LNFGVSKNNSLQAIEIGRGFAIDNTITSQVICTVVILLEKLFYNIKHIIGLFKETKMLYPRLCLSVESVPYPEIALAP
jgi:hypothetical protein